MTADEDGAAGDAERRASERTEILGDLRGEVMIFQPMTIREISATGAQIETDLPPSAELPARSRASNSATPPLSSRDGSLIAASRRSMGISWPIAAALNSSSSAMRVSTVIVRFIGGIRSGRLAR